MRSGRFLAALLLLVVAAMPAAGATELVSFQTPTRNIGCLYFKDGAAVSLRCDLVANDAAIPRAPAGCEFDWGNAFEMTERGRSGRICVSDTAAGTGPLVAYGKTWKRGGFTCSSLTTGLTCRNLAGHGWTLTRRSQKLF